MKNLTEYSDNMEIIAPVDVDTDFIIQNELDRFLEEKRRRRNRLSKNIALVVISLILLAGIIIFAPRISRYFTDTWNFAQTYRATKIIKRNAPTIKAMAMAQLPVEYFSDYRVSDSPINIETKLMHLIHQFGTDFYSKLWDIKPFEERRVYAYVDMKGFDIENFYNLDRPLVDDSSQTLKDWLINKVSMKQSRYYNPRYGELIQTIAAYRSEYQKELNRPLGRRTYRRIRRELADKQIKPKRTNDVINASTQFLIANPDLLSGESYYRRKLMDLELELNIRLALFHMVLARDYNIRGNTAVFGWINGNMKGVKLIKESTPPPEYRDLYNTLKKNVNSYYVSYGKARKQYKNTDFNELHLILHNPLRIGLVVKDVGLFGSARKNGKGVYYEHKGIDLIAEEGTPVYPVQDGYVCYVGNNGNGHGNHIEIWHDSNVRSVYSHLKDDKVWRQISQRFQREGPFLVTTNERISSVGMSGNIPEGDPQYGYSHLHLEVKESGKPINPFLLLNDKIKVIH